MQQILQAKQAQTKNNDNSEIPPPLFSAANLQAAATNSQNDLKLTPNSTEMATVKPVHGDSQVNTPQPVPTPQLNGNTPVNTGLSPSQQLLNSASPIQSPLFSPVTPTGLVCSNL